MWITGAVCTGILLSHFFDPGWNVALISLLLLGSAYIVLEKRSVVVRWPLKSTLLILLIIVLGIFRFDLEKGSANPYSLDKNYLSGDVLVGSLDEIQESGGSYQKCFFKTEALIRLRDTITVRDRILLFAKDSSHLLRSGNRCVLGVDLMKIANKGNPGEFDSKSYWEHKGIRYLAFASEDQYEVISQGTRPWFHIFRDLQQYFGAILDQHLSGDSRAVAKALILGDRSQLDSEIRSKFGNAGAMHVLAVSGLHVGILVEILTLFFGLFANWISKKQAVYAALACVWCYAFLTGFSPSVGRSALMFSALSLSALYGKGYNNFNVLAFSAFVLLMINPHMLFDLGFQLSFLAMLGIFMFYKPLSRVWKIPNRYLRKLYEGTMVGVAAQLMTFPLTLYYFHQFPNYFMLTNIGLMLLSFLTLFLGLLLVTFSWSAWLAKWIALLLLGMLVSMIALVSFIDELPGSVAEAFVPGIPLVLAFLGLGVFLYLAIWRKNLSWLKTGLLVSAGCVLILIFTRTRQMERHEVCFFQSRDIAFVVRLGQQSFVFYNAPARRLKSIRFLAESYRKTTSGTMNYYNLKDLEQAHLKVEEWEILIQRDKTGYQVELGDKKFLLATNYGSLKKGTSTIICAPWLDPPKGAYHLKRGGLRFNLN